MNEDKELREDKLREEADSRERDLEDGWEPAKNKFVPPVDPILEIEGFPEIEH